MSKLPKIMVSLRSVLFSYPSMILVWKPVFSNRMHSRTMRSYLNKIGRIP
jgi:hypothetical protein